MIEHRTKMDPSRPATPKWKLTWNGLTASLLALLIALTINSFFLLVPPPVSVTRNLYFFRIDTALLLILFYGIVFSRKGYAWEITGMALILILFSVPLIYKWQTAGYYGYLIGGLLPWSDAQSYYSGAYQLIYYGQLDSWATRRPLFGAFLAVLLSLTGQNLQIALVIMSMLNGLANFLALSEIRKTHGPFGAAIFMAICYWFYCYHAGNTASEQLGLCLGSLGLAFLIHGVRNVAIQKAACGLFLLTIALNARAGAFFILPAIALYFGFQFSDGKKRATPVLIGLAVIVAGMLANLTLVKIIGSPNTTPFSNYSYTLYGLASGNKGWSQVIRDYPAVKEEDVFGLALQKIRDSPSLFVKGMLRSYGDYFTITRGQFSFLNRVSHYNPLGSQLLWVLTWLALASALNNYRQRQSGLILAGFLGILLSAGLVPPIDSDTMRVYAATIPYIAYITSAAAVPLTLPLKKIDHIAMATQGVFESSVHLLLPVGAMMLTFCFVGPLPVKVLSPPLLPSPTLYCPPGQKAISYLVGRNSSFYLNKDPSVRETYVPNVKFKDLTTSIRTGSILYPFITKTLGDLKPGDALSVILLRPISNDNASLQGAYLITTGGPPEFGFHEVCVQSVQDQDTSLPDFFVSDQPAVEPTTPGKSFLFYRNLSIVNAARKRYGLGLILIFIFAFLDFLGFRSISSLKRFLLLGCMIFILMIIFVYPQLI